MLLTAQEEEEDGNAKRVHFDISLASEQHRKLRARARFALLYQVLS